MILQLLKIAGITLLVNGERMAFGSPNHIELYPEKLKRLISLILDITGELYVLPGFS